MDPASAAQSASPRPLTSAPHSVWTPRPSAWHLRPPRASQHLTPAIAPHPPVLAPALPARKPPRTTPPPAIRKLPLLPPICAHGPGERPPQHQSTIAQRGGNSAAHCSRVCRSWHASGSDQLVIPRYAAPYTRSMLRKLFVASG